MGGKATSEYDLSRIAFFGARGRGKRGGWVVFFTGVSGVWNEK